MREIDGDLADRAVVLQRCSSIVMIYTKLVTVPSWSSSQRHAEIVNCIKLYRSISANAHLFLTIWHRATTGNAVPAAAIAAGAKKAAPGESVPASGDPRAHARECVKSDAPTSPREVGVAMSMIVARVESEVARRAGVRGRGSIQEKPSISVDRPRLCRRGVDGLPRPSRLPHGRRRRLARQGRARSRKAARRSSRPASGSCCAKVSTPAASTRRRT